MSALLQWAVVLLLAHLNVCCAAAAPLPIVNASGSHYEIGLTVGKFQAEQIRQYLAGDEFNQILLPFFQNNNTLFEAYKSVNSEAYPQYVDELQGMADGAGVGLDMLFLVALRLEIEILSSPSPHRVACTDLLHSTDNGESRFFAHNEDGDVQMRGLTFLLSAAPEGEPAFVSYNYPAALAGTSFGYNDHGVCVSFNAVFPTNLKVPGVARAFVNRDILASGSVSDAVVRAVAAVANFSAGFSMNVGSSVEFDLVNVETAPGTYIIRDVPATGNFSHENMYRDLTSQPQQLDESSVHRLARINELAAPSTPAAALAILGDHADREWPIYRDGAPPDTGVVTLATASFDLSAGVLALYDANPSSSDPIYVVSLPSSSSSAAALGPP